MFERHGGSPLLLLGLLLLANSGLQLTLYNVYMRPLLRFSLASAPALVAITLARGGAICRVLLAAPGAVETLVRLHHLLGVTQ